MKDDDFREIFESVRSAQGKFIKTHYFVSPNASDEVEYLNLVPIATDGTHFLKVIKKHFCSSLGYIRDEVFDYLNEDLYDLQEAHSKFWEEFNPKSHPQMLLSATYQDGMIHAYEIARDQRSTGEFSDGCLLHEKVSQYEVMIDQYKQDKKYSDAAYFQGYQNVLIAIHSSIDDPEFPRPPLCYYHKIGEMEIDEFREKLELLPKLHKTAYKYCKEVVARLPDDGSIVLQHTPWR